MDSSTHRIQLERQRKEQLQAQIAKLQAELAELPQTNTVLPPSPKRKKPEPTLLAPATPSPKKKRKLAQPAQGPPIPKPVFRSTGGVNSTLPSKSSSTTKQELPKVQPWPSNLIEKLSSVKSETVTTRAPEVNRSTSFTERALPNAVHPECDSVVPTRDEELRIVEDLWPGPYEHTPPSDDPSFEKLEPHSNIALTSRNISHEDFQDHLRGRYFLSPSQLYSSIRLQADKQHYDVPVPGDWVTIAVVAERGPLKYTRAPVTLGPDEDADPKNKWKKRQDEGVSKPMGKKYVNMKLIDFGARTRSSATGGKAVVRGDAFLSLLLFEADSVELVTKDDGSRPEKLYKGGSKGAFETLEKLKEGDVIALLNPRILKPFQRASDKPHPVDNILAVTPESASSIAVLGRSRDLGMCTVQKRDGKVCGSWCDKRVSDVCDYHIQNAVQHRRAARPEFSAGTGGMSMSATVKRKHDYDPARQWGLKPEPGLQNGTGATYMVSGHVVHSDSNSSLFVSENIGREGQAKAKRKLANSEADKALKLLLQRDREGMQSVMKVREAVAARAVEKGKGKEKTTKGERRTSKKAESETSGAVKASDSDKHRKSYSTNLIRSLGFDPTVKAGHRRIENTDASVSKFEALSTLCANRKSMELGPAPGPKKRSNIVAPVPPVAGGSTDCHSSPGDSSPKHPDTLSEPPEEEMMIDLDDI